MKWYCSNTTCKYRYECKRNQFVTSPPVYAEVINAETFSNGEGCDGFMKREYIRHTPIGAK
jgi:hypothetical protein